MDRRSSVLVLGSALAAVAIASATACNVFRSTKECDLAIDCPRGTTCSDSNFCRSGGPIQMGLLLPLTGSSAEQAKSRLRAVRFGQWILETQTAKVLGRGLDISVRDTLGSADAVDAMTKDLIARNVSAILGPVASADVLLADKRTYPLRLLHIGIDSGASSVGDAEPTGALNRFLFQLSTEIRYGTVRAIPLFLADPKHPASFDVCFDGVATLVTDDTTGASFAGALADLLPQNCIPVTASVKVPRDKKASYEEDVASLLAANKDGKPTRCLFVQGAPDVAGEVLRTLVAAEAKLSSRPPYSAFFGSSSLDTPDFFDAAKSVSAGQPSLAEGFFGVDADIAPPRAEFRDLEALWEGFVAAHPDEDLPPKFRGETSPWAESVIMLGLALEQAGRADDPVALRDAFVEVLQPGDDDLVVGPSSIDSALARVRAGRAQGRKTALDYRGALGDYDLGERGFVDYPTVVWRAKDGAIEKFVGYTAAECQHAWDKPGPACKR